MRLARHYYISGIVQGVGFRYFTYKTAQKHNISGYVRNLDDGRVEVSAEGNVEDLDRFLSELRRGPRGAVVQNITVEERTPSHTQSFTIA